MLTCQMWKMRQAVPAAQPAPNRTALDVVWLPLGAEPQFDRHLRANHPHSMPVRPEAQYHIDPASHCSWRGSSFAYPLVQIVRKAGVGHFEA